MANETVDLKSEERRRQITLMLLGGLLFVTTVPVVNQRALFSPLGDVPILGDLSPVAYAATFGMPLRPGSPGGAGGPPVMGGGEAPRALMVRGHPVNRVLVVLRPAERLQALPGIIDNPPTLLSPQGTPTGGNGSARRRWRHARWRRWYAWWGDTRRWWWPSRRRRCYARWRRHFARRGRRGARAGHLAHHDPRVCHRRRHHAPGPTARGDSTACRPGRCRPYRCRSGGRQRRLTRSAVRVTESSLASIF